eukprot:3231357-Pleurochrysis_carterae.AAC.2
MVKKHKRRGEHEAEGHSRRRTGVERVAAVWKCRKDAWASRLCVQAALEDVGRTGAFEYLSCVTIARAVSGVASGSSVLRVKLR